MAVSKVYALFWFDVEDCTVPQSDDAARQVAICLSRHGVKGTFKVVGQKARVLEQRVRYKVIDEISRHEIGFHSNWHGLRPQVAEYLADMDWDVGADEFEKRESPGLASVRRLFGTNPVTYGQPGSNWAPHVFPVLRKWGIPTYVSGYGYVGLDCQPFWYGGILCTSHMYGRRLTGAAERHHMGLNFELGRPGELEKHKRLFSCSYEQLRGSGGLISIINHPCTLVLEEWFSSFLKPRELTEAGFRQFAQFVEWVLSLADVQTVAASDLLRLYPDGAVGRLLTRDELYHIAAALSHEVSFLALGSYTLSAAEAFGVLVPALASYVAEGRLPADLRGQAIAGPTNAPTQPTAELQVSWDTFAESLSQTAVHLGQRQCVPLCLRLGGECIEPADYLAAVARHLVLLLDGHSAQETVRITPAARRFEDFVDEEAARTGWQAPMLPADFAAPKLIELAKLGAWTLKPAVLA